MKKRRVSHRFLTELRKIPIVEVACDKVGISRNTVYTWRKNDRNFRLNMEEALTEGEKLVDDMVEGKYLSLINSEKWQAIKHYLDRKHPKYKLKIIKPESKISKDGEIKASRREMSLEIDELKKKLELERKWREPINPKTLKPSVLKDVREFQNEIEPRE
jgi:hypothetical protein